MGISRHRLWPFGARTGLFSAPIILLSLLVLVAALRDTTGWPTDASERLVLLGVFVLSLVPLSLAVVDTLVERGAVLEYAGAKLDFSRVTGPAAPAVSVPVNIGVPGRAVSDSDTSEILHALREAVTTDIVVVDLEDGGAWWETRLLVLLAGAVRLGRPAAVVFVATDRGVARRFEGWGKPGELLRCLLRSDRRYQESYWAALAAARQWELVPPGPGGVPPAPQPWMQGLGVAHSWIAFDSAMGLPNELAAEQFLAADVGAKIEMTERPTGMTVVRLEELFRPILHSELIDETWSGDRQLEAFLEGIDPYVAVTHSGSYQRLLSRMVGLNAIVKALTTPSAKT